MRNSIFLLIPIVVLVLAGTGCTGVNSFGTAARAGDTIVVSLGWQQELTRADIEVTVTDNNLESVVYPPGDPAIRALWQSYPDPISNLIVGGETDQDNIDGSFAGLATVLIDGAATGGDKDYSQTFMMIDLPDGMALGPATISFTDPLGNPIDKPTVAGGQLEPMNVEIVATGGSPDIFQTQDDIIVLDGYLNAMERTTHYTVTLEGGSVPYGVHLKFTHDADLDNGGTGRAYVSHPRSDLKSIIWRDDGFNLDVILLPAQAKYLADIKQFKFFIAGGITGLTLISTEAYDINGVSINDDGVPENDIVAVIN
jgi:hypothetical protein